jgi:rhodanese-related sulfurtransferase/DNA-binding transcriptional ArsR family regulator
MAEQEPVNALNEQFARIGKALANPVRLHLLDLLTQAERSVEELATAAGARIGNTSAQLRMLHEVGLVRSRRAGTRIYYRIADEQVATFIEGLKEFALARLAEARLAAQAHLGDVSGLDPVGKEELLRRMQQGDVVVLDVRPETEFKARHIPGAISVPLEELESRLAELPADQEIVAYCRGRYCVLSPDAVRLLRQHGYRARLLRGGLIQWRLAGFPLLGNTPDDDSDAAGMPGDGPSSCGGGGD